MRIVGVTGTNGKTTTATLLAHIVRTSGEREACVTTLGSWVDGQQLSDEPDLEAFLRCLERAREQGVRTLVLETTSKALAEGFAHRFPVDVAVLTSFSRDHLDYHGSPEQYLAAKAQLFSTLGPTGTAVLNADAEASQLIDEVTPASARRLWYSASREAGALCAEHVEVSAQGTRVVLCSSKLADTLGMQFRLKVHGAHFAEDALAAALAAHALGYRGADIRRALESYSGVPGRFQLVSAAPLVVVDYAHTPDALSRTLAVAACLSAGAPVIVVFGCGGERDQGKRHDMGRAAAESAGLVVLTNDNPRGEDPAAILEEIARGCLAAGAREEVLPNLRRTLSSAGPCVVTRVFDRRGAIAAAIDVARQWKGSCVVIAGKGHERVQWIGVEQLPFHDPSVVEELLAVAEARPCSG